MKIQLFYYYYPYFFPLFHAIKMWKLLITLKLSKCEYGSKNPLHLFLLPLWWNCNIYLIR